MKHMRYTTMALYYIIPTSMNDGALMQGDAWR